MNRTLLTLALVAAAGTAGAQTTSTPSTITNGNTGTQGAQMGVGTQAQTNSNIRSLATGQMNSNGQMGAGGQMNGNMNASGAANPSMANAPAPRLTGAAGTAQKRIEQDGYKNVQNLQQGSDGLWHGTAMRGSTQVQVTVDRAGRVSAQ